MLVRPRERSKGSCRVIVVGGCRVAIMKLSRGGREKGGSGMMVRISSSSFEPDLRQWRISSAGVVSGFACDRW